MYLDESEKTYIFNNYYNYNYIEEDFYFNNQKNYLTEKMNIFETIEESSSHDDLNFTKTRLNLENLLPEPVNNDYYNCIRQDFNDVEAKCFQGFGQISYQSADRDDQEGNENFDSEKNKISNESSKDYKKENISFDINLNNNYKNKEKEEKNYLVDNKEKEIIFKLEKIPKSEKTNDNLSKKIRNKKNNCGRKKKSDSNKRKHNKSCGDNIIIKIKGYFFTFIRDITKNNFINKTLYFRKLPYKFISKLSKKFNVRLMNMQMKDILSEIPITTKNKKSHKFENKFIVEKLYKEEKEKKVIQILDLTFRELFIIFRRKLNYVGDKAELEIISKKIEDLDLLKDNNYKDINYLIDQIRNKSKNMDEDSDTEITEDDYEKYIKELRYFCCIYEKWFKKKIARNSKKNKN
jgi:hypothetical protein